MNVEPILSRYHLPALSVTALGNRGGFSGASLWRCHSPLSDFCLRRWPETIDDSHLTFIHHVMTEARLDFVPRLMRTPQGHAIVEQDGRCWDLTTWMPGAADFHRLPTNARLEAACVALASIHRAWESLSSRRGPCSAVQRRLETWGRWGTLVIESSSPDALAHCATEALRRWAPVEINALEQDSREVMSLQPCLCDVWHDHLLFEGDRLTGLIDYGEVKIDHVAVDLARMLGSLVEDDDERWRIGVEAYRRVRPLSEDEVRLARRLDTSGVLMGITNWLRWLYHERRPFEDLDRARGRLTRLVERVERWGGSQPLLLV